MVVKTMQELMGAVEQDARIILTIPRTATHPEITGTFRSAETTGPTGFIVTLNTAGKNGGTWCRKNYLPWR